MTSYKLTEDHKRILRQLVGATADGSLARTFLVSGSNAGWNIMHWKGGDRPDLEYMDLQVLEEEGFLSLRVTSYSTKTGNISSVECILRPKAFDGVSTDFAPPKPVVPGQINIGAVISAMSGGSVQAVGVADNAVISQVVNDPTLLHSQLERLTEKLLNEVGSALTGSDLIEYTQAVQRLKQGLQAEKPNPSLLKRLTGTLAFLADIEGTIALMVRAWPYLYPLLLIAAERLG